MKQLITFCILFTLAVSAYSYNYKPGDTLYVAALQGLNVRETAGGNGKVLTKLACGDTLVVVDLFNLSLDSIDGFYGGWIRVRPLPAKQEGYVFDAFISHYPVLKKEQLMVGVGDRILNTLRGGLRTLFSAYVFFAFHSNGCNFTYDNGEAEEDAYSMTVKQFDGHNQFVTHYYPWEGDYLNELELHQPRQSEMYYLVLNLLKYMPDSLYRVQQQELHNAIVYGLQENDICIVKDNQDNCVIRFLAKQQQMLYDGKSYPRSAILVNYSNE